MDADITAPFKSSIHYIAMYLCSFHNVFYPGLIENTCVIFLATYARLHCMNKARYLLGELAA